MKTTYSHSTSMLDHPVQFLLVIFTFLRPRVKRGREGGGRLGNQIVVVTTLLVTFTFGLSILSAKPVRRTRNIAAYYDLNKPLSETDGPEMRQKLAALLLRCDVQTFLAVIQKAEAGEKDIMVGGCRARTLKVHLAYTLPNRCQYRFKWKGKWVTSTASGLYQLTLTNWKELAPFLGLRDFGVINQQIAALELIRRGGGARSERTQAGFTALVQGRLKQALCLATRDWASSWCSPLPANEKVNLVRLAPIVRAAMKCARPPKTKPKRRTTPPLGRRQTA